MNAQRKSTVARKRPATNPDRDLFAAYRKFAKVDAAMQAADTREAKAGSGLKPTAAQRRAFKKWERLLDRQTDIASDFVVMPSNTINGMLLKIQVAERVEIADPATLALGDDLRRLKGGDA